MVVGEVVLADLHLEVLPLLPELELVVVVGREHVAAGPAVDHVVALLLVVEGDDLAVVGALDPVELVGAVLEVLLGGLECPANSQ